MRKIDLNHQVEKASRAKFIEHLKWASKIVDKWPKWKREVLGSIPRKDPLSIELKYFNKNRKKWLKHHLGKFALIKGTTIYNFYDTAENAFNVGVEIWGAVPFFIKEVR